MGGRVRDTDWEPGCPPTDLELPGEGEAGHTPQGPGGLPGLTPEQGRVAATWATGQASKRSQWALELWKATEDRRAALIALKQSEETLHQVWQQVGPPWLGLIVRAPPAASFKKKHRVAQRRGAVKPSTGAAASRHVRGLRPTS